MISVMDNTNPVRKAVRTLGRVYQNSLLTVSAEYLGGIYVGLDAYSHGAKAAEDPVWVG